MGPATAQTPAPEDAVARCRAEVEERAHDPRAWVSLGRALWFTNARDEALAALEQALLVDPACADAHNNLGNAAFEAGDRDRAIAHYQSALRANPGHAEGHYNLGNAWLACDNAGEAIACFERAIALKPDHAGAHNNLGNVQRAIGRIEDGIASYRRALALQPGSIGTLGNLAIALISLNRPEEALAPLGEVLSLDPGHGEAANNLGGALLALDRLEEAAAAFARSIAAAPDQPQARFGRALALLGMGRMIEGWAEYEVRWLDPQFRDGKADPPVPRWHGEPLDGRTVLLHAEQGLGDTMQFARYAPLVEARGGAVVLRVPATLRTLLAPLARIVIGEDDPLPPIDLHCPLLSLPHVFATDLDSVPAPIPYLAADPRRVARFGYLRPARGRLRVGIAFSGSASHTDDTLRSIPAATFLARLRVTGAMLHVLQTDLRPADVEALAAAEDVDVHAADLADFADTAALAARMDLIVTVDTSIAHLAGAMGLPTWVLLQRAADFRWMRTRTDSPWYPTMRLFRQTRSGDWTSVLDEVADAIGAFVAPPR